MVFPWIAFLKESKKRLSDIEFLAIKEFDGKRVDADAQTTVSNTTTETDVVTVTANTGKDMYLASATVHVNMSVSQTFDATYRLYANGTVVDAAYTKYLISSSDVQYYAIKFDTKGIKVAANQIIKITVQHSTATSTSVTVNAGKLVLWEEDTGNSPQV